MRSRAGHEGNRRRRDGHAADLYDHSCGGGLDGLCGAPAASASSVGTVRYGSAHPVSPSYSVFAEMDLPNKITRGPDGAYWFTNVGSNSIGRVTATGTLADFTAPGINSLGGITAGPDGALWFTNEGTFNGNAWIGSSTGRITMNG